MRKKTEKPQVVLVKNSKPGNPVKASEDSEMNEAIYAHFARINRQASEFVTSMQIIATKVEKDGSTSYFAAGFGDIYARTKALERFLNAAGA